MTLVFLIPNPIGINGLYYNAPGKGRRKTKAYGIWRCAAMWAMKIENGRARTWETIAGPVEVEITIGNPRQDADAPVKAILDILQNMRVVENDKQVSKLSVSRGAPSKDCIVTIRELVEARAA